MTQVSGPVTRIWRPRGLSLLVGLILGLLAIQGIGGLEAQGPAAPSIAAQPVEVWIKVYPLEHRLIQGGTVLRGSPGKTPGWKLYRIPDAGKDLRLEAEGYVAKVFRVGTKARESYEIKLERDPSLTGLTSLGLLATGRQPKSVIAIDGGQRLLVAQLDGQGIDVYSTEPFARVGSIIFPVEIARAGGFVEFAWLPWQQEVWVSQMTRDQVHVIDARTLTYKQSLSTGGSWPKVITLHPTRDLAFVSNWVGESVAVFDTVTKRRIGLWKTTGTPRGMVTSPDGVYLYVASFGTGALDKFHISSGRKTKTLQMGRGAKRHLVTIPERGLLVATDMELGEVWVFNMVTDTLVKRIPVGPKLNTCDLSPDNRFLFVSSRGTNNPESYLIKGPDFGRVYVLDTQTWEVVDWAWGKNQPTGLAVHPREPLLWFTNFLDYEIEMYDYRGLYLRDWRGATPSVPPRP